MDKDYFDLNSSFAEDISGLSLSEIKQLSHPYFDMLPKFLYKYRSFDDPNDFLNVCLTKKRFYASSIDSFVDRFEGITTLTKDKILNSDLKNLFSSYKTVFIEFVEEKFGSINKNNAEMIYDLISQENFKTETVYKKTYKLIPLEQRKYYHQIIDSFSYFFKEFGTEYADNSKFVDAIMQLLTMNSIVGVFCLSKTATNEVMWETYSKNYEGYCVEYDLTKPARSKGSIEFIKLLFPVKYDNNKDDDWLKFLVSSSIEAIQENGNIDVEKASTDFANKMYRVLCTKTVRHSYEEEWRFLGTAKHYYHCPIISSIIVGDKISKENFIKIKKICEMNYYDLKMIQIDYETKKCFIKTMTAQDIEKFLN